MLSLHLRMGLLVAVLFALIYALVAMLGSAMGITNFYFYLILSLVVMFIQYLVGPKIVEWSMQIRYIRKEENPRLFAIVRDLSYKAGIPEPRICVSPVEIPNAFAFGRGLRDGRVCVTQGILRLLEENELKAVLGHELSHLKNRDVLTMMLLSVIPMILYRVALSFMFSGRRRDERGSNTVLIGILAFAFYFLSNLLVLYASRIREYFADKGSVDLGCKPSDLASSLYKLVYGSARLDKENIQEVQGLKAFFVNDPSRAVQEFKTLQQLDSDKSGSLDAAKLARLRNSKIRLSFGEKMLELFSTHPNMLKRVKKLSEYRA